MHRQVLIIGGGLAGLSLARLLHREGRSFALLEARARLGGRILSLPLTNNSDRSGDTSGDRYDLGPAWFWPHQDRIGRMVRELGLDVFEQYSTGRLVLQEHDGSVRRDLDFATMRGALRVEGGIARLVDELAAQLPADTLMTGRRVTRLHIAGGADRNIQVSGIAGDGPFEASAEFVVLALPPRVAQHGITFDPGLDTAENAALAEMPTWMAAHAKVVTTYPQPFWRDQGLSGDGISRRGPLAEIHDASPASGPAGALFGFVGTPIGAADRQAERVADLAIDQLATMFGDEARQPDQVLYMDWAEENLTASPQDRRQPASHQVYRPAAAFDRLWNGCLVFASSEMSASNWGLLEGAIDAAETAHRRILHGRITSLE